ncbi:uncharacterized protein Pyn_24228 [Prunus yedoensis var. nudiflora]|uniref:Uncharacterized protein n=1 Tax=Prunus yedoensis var. nudiflora TaxID=2094558 RepID=A0A314URQ6_PRUYE|nr:uncharacterized protein Pyn_24228 [Prunus yedoensis var. nudiflora]
MKRGGSTCVSSNGIQWARGAAHVMSNGEADGIRPSHMVIMSNPMHSSVYWLYNMNKWVKCLSTSLPGLACSQDGRNWARIEGNLHSGALLMLDIMLCCWGCEIQRWDQVGEVGDEESKKGRLFGPFDEN